MPKNIARNEARQAIVELALVHLAERGPANVHPKDICEELGLSKALVNYHFGGRDGLIAEAMATGYERYVDLLWEAADAAGADPLERVLAWVDRQVEWTRDNAGLALALNFPHLTAGMPGEMLEEHVDRLTDAGSRNFANLQKLVRAAQQQAPGAGEPTAVKVGMDAALIGWLTLGVSVWSAGNHLPTQRLESRERFDEARGYVRAHIRNMIGQTSGKPTR